MLRHYIKMDYQPNSFGNNLEVTNAYSGGRRRRSRRIRGGGTRTTRKSDGLFHVSGHTYKDLVGTRRKVYNKTAHHTPGGLTKDDLLLNKNHRIVSKKKHNTAKREKRLEKYGYFAKKGKFGAIRK